MLAEIIGSDRDLAARLFPRAGRQKDAPGSGLRFEPGREVPAVAVDVVAVDDDVAEIDPDTKLDPLAARHIRVALSDAALHVDGAANRIDHAGKLDEHAVAGSPCHAAV